MPIAYIMSISINQEHVIFKLRQVGDIKVKPERVKEKENDV